MLILLPLIFLKRLSYIGVFSAVAMAFTLVAIALILYMCGMVLSKSPEEN